MPRLLNLYYIILATCCTICWLIVSFNNRLADDDLLMRIAVNEHGVWKATILLWEGWNTRWASLLFVNLWLSNDSLSENAWIFNLITFLLLTFSFTMLLRSLELKQFIKPLNHILRSAVAIILFAALISISYHIGDTWFWITTSPMYGWNLGVFIIALSLLLLPVRRYHDPVLFFCGIYIGGSGEIFAAVLAASPLLLLFPNIKNNFQNDHRYKFFYAGIILALAIAVSGQGHSVRSAMLPDTSFITLINEGIYGTLKISGYHTPMRMLIMIAFLITLTPLIHPEIKPVRISLIKIFIMTLALTAIHVFAITYLMGDAGPPRAWSSISLIIFISSITLIYKYSNQIKNLLPVKMMTLIMILFVILFSCYQYKITNTYVKAYEQRYELIKSSRHLSEFDTLYVPALPDAGMLHANELHFRRDAWIKMKAAVIEKPDKN